MKRTTLIFTLSFQLIALAIFAQSKNINLSDSAYAYYQKKDFKKAAYFFDTYYLEQKQAQSNYGTYYAAVASSYLGNFEQVKYYLKRSGEIGYDYSGFYDFDSYDLFVNDTVHNQLRNLPEWKNFIGIIKYKADSALISKNKITAALIDTTNRANRSILNDSVYWQKYSKNNSATALINKIKSFNSYASTKKANFWTLYYVKVNDTLTVPFLVYIPKNYQSNQQTPLYVYLHGAVAGRKQFSDPATIENSIEVKVMDKAKAQNAFIIYPFGKKDFGWLYQQGAFETILKEIAFVKSLYNINDNKVYIGGHSNGGSGAFWYALNQPSPFASFFGFNYLPKVYGSNTSLRNLNNIIPFYGISGTEDRIFPISTVVAFHEFAVANGANWKNAVKKGGHGLPFDNRDSVDFLFDTLATKSRNPFPKKIEWETDNIKNGRNAWIEISQLDTLAEKANWHQVLNPTVTQNGKSGMIDFNKNKSGAIIATAEGNHINIQTSRVKKVTLYISPDMFDLNKQIKITINGKSFINTSLEPNKQDILTEFLKTKDRIFIVSNKIEISVE